MKKIIVQLSIMALVLAGFSGCQGERAVQSAGYRDMKIKSRGDAIVFSRLAEDYWQIWTMEPDGKNARQITTSKADKRYPVLSKGGKELFFRTNNNQVFSFNPETGQEKHILSTFGTVGGVVPSPDGNQLLFVRFRSQLKDSSSLWLIKTNGKDSRMLASEVGLQYDPAWSPDGRKIAYIFGHDYRTDELYIIDSDGKNKRRLTDNSMIELLPAFSPDSKTIAYVSDVTGNYEIWSMDINGGSRRQLTVSDGIDTRPSWSPDGREIVFASNRSGQLQLWVMNSNGSNPRQLTTGPPSMDPVWWSN